MKLKTITNITLRAKKVLATVALSAACVGISFTSYASPTGIHFDGLTNYADIGIIFPGGGQSYTKEAWVKANANQTDNIITGSDDPFWLSGGYLRAAHGWQRIPRDVMDSTPFPIGQWVHVAVTYDAPNNTMKLYKNGVIVAMDTAMIPYGETYLQVGAYNAGNASNFFDGDIDEVRVWNRPLCIDEINTTMNGEITGNENGLLVYYKMDDNILGIVSDLSGLKDYSPNNNNGTFHSISFITTAVVSDKSPVYVPPVATCSAGGPTSVSTGSKVTLTANSSFGYQWKKDGQDITDANDQTYDATVSGNYNVMITIPNGCSNVSSVVPVVVSAAPSQLIPPANISACSDNAGNSKTLTLSTAGLNNPTVTYAITGANNATGTGAVVTKNFNVGVSTITWTVTDAVNGTRKAAATVTIMELPVATISTSVPDVFCDEMALMAKSSHTGTNTFLWTHSNSIFSYAQIIDLDNSLSDGNYTVKITDKNGCTSAPVSYNYQKQNTLGSYTLLAYKSVDLDNNNDLLSGSIGVMNCGGSASIQSQSSVPDPGFIKASNISIPWCGVSAPNRYYGQANVALPTMLTNTANTSNLSNYTKNSSGTINTNYKNLTIGNNVNVTVTGNTFHKITIGQNAQVSFTCADINIDTLIINDNATVTFTQDAKFRVSKRVIMNDNITFNPGAQKVSFFMSDAATDVVKFTVGYNNNITANIFMPHGNLQVNDAANNCNWRNSNNCHGHNHNNCCNSNTGTFMIGFYICERITAGQNVTWDNYTCLNVPVSKQTNNPTLQSIENAVTEVKAYPNPSTGDFTIALPVMNDNAELKVYDVTGKVIFSKAVAHDDDRYQKVNLDNVARGIYIIDVQGNGISYKSKMTIQ